MKSKVTNIADVARHFRDGMSILFGGFMGAGTPPVLIKALLDSGVKDLTLSLKLPPAQYARAAGPVIQQEFADIGVKVDITNVEWADWLQNVFTNKDYDLTIVSHVEPNDFGAFAKDGYYFHYSNPAFNALMQDLQRAASDDERTRILQEAQRILANDAVNGFLFQLPKIGVWNAALKGQWADSPVQANDLTGVYWEGR